jgi:hypothetical protein
MLTDFHLGATIEIDEAATQSRQTLMSSLTSFADEIRADLETRQRAWQDEAKHSSEHQSEQFRQRLESILSLAESPGTPRTEPPIVAIFGETTPFIGPAPLTSSIFAVFVLR